MGIEGRIVAGVVGFATIPLWTPASAAPAHVGAVAAPRAAEAARTPASTSLDPAGIEEAIRKAAACLARDHDGAAFNDPYLRHTYLNDGLPAPEPPPGGRRITYRMVDADILLSLVAREGAAPPELDGAIDVAAARLESLLPIWRRLGPRNTSRGADPHGVALDTYCAVGWLHRDESMAAAAEAALDGDRWLPVGFHDGIESFRALLDESWCLALVASTHGRLFAHPPLPQGPGREGADAIATSAPRPPVRPGRELDLRAAGEDARGGDPHGRRREAEEDPAAARADPEDRGGLGRAGPVLDRLAAEFRRDRERDPLGRGVFYEAWHLAMVLHELGRTASPGAGPRDGDLRAEVVATLSDWFHSHRGARASRRDVLEWANLAAVEILAPGEEARIREGALEQILDWQEEDGCWSPLDASRPGRGRSFLTLRALLALARHRGAGDPRDR